jgi:hypothetical protein
MKTEQRPDGHEWVTQCSDQNCGGGCFVCCCGYCKLCGLAEGCTTTECPGVESYREHGDAVYKGQEDFRDGQWVAMCSKHSPRWFDSPEYLAEKLN